MLLYCGNAASGHHSAVMNAVDPSATMTATVGAMVHQHPQQAEGGNSPKSGSPPPAGASPATALGAHTGQGNATVVNSIATDQMSAILNSLGVAHTHVTAATARETSSPPPASPQVKRVQSTKGFAADQTDVVSSTLNILDGDFDGEISFTDFLQLMLKKVEISDVDQMRLAFRYFDKGGVGTVTTNQFVEMFATMGEQSSPEEIDEMLAFADPDGTGCIDYVSFLNNLAFGA